MARAAKHDFGRLDQSAGELAEPIDTLFADTGDTGALGPWGDRARRTQLVFIGRDLDRQALRKGFETSLD